MKDVVDPGSSDSGPGQYWSDSDPTLEKNQVPIELNEKLSYMIKMAKQVKIFEEKKI